MTEAAIVAQGLGKDFAAAGSQAKVAALAALSLEVPAASITALVGPDGAGKSTFIRLAAGLLRPDRGALQVLGLDVARQPQAVQDRIGYMPQRFGLYEDLSVQENLDLYADLHGVPSALRRQRYARLMEMTDLGPFRSRLAGKLSGGMKQKLGLACTLVRSPELLLLDEPTVGVDPLSRRELWQIVEDLRASDGVTVLVATAYLDEAERCARVYLLREGRLLAGGTPAALREPARGRVHVAEPPPGQAPRLLQSQLLADRARVVDAVPEAGAVRFIRRAGAAGTSPQPQARSVEPRLEDGFMLLLDAADAAGAAGAADAATAATAATAGAQQPQPAAPIAAAAAQGSEPVITVQHLTRRFGDFVAVDDTSFEVRRGEVFGLLGPNGAGKTTTFRMLCGLLPASSGQLRVAGVDMRRARAAARRHIGYVAQKFALYANLSVDDNLRFFAGAYGLTGAALQRQLQRAYAEFGLQDVKRMPSGQLPGGYRQRLAMAAALLHEPQILFLDEPTSGADPHARRAFWRRITLLAAAGTTVVVTTHFMEEAEYCDRIVIQDAGRVLALGTPAEVRAQAGAAANMEQAFIGVVEAARRGLQAAA
ncbi:MAG: ABC transporter ATP-binding protein [Proteobacteria bacterium]|nr:ABC transporter ATP-binding protein [Pseudomonadota bacterium]